MEPVETVAATLRRLRKAGVAIVLDDFGTGFSSLHYLRDFTVDKIKIDRSFMQYAEEKGAGGSIVQSMVELARSLNLKVTAEGVETDLQWSALRACGCDELQGFRFSKPLSSAALADFAAKGRDAASAA